MLSLLFFLFEYKRAACVYLFSLYLKTGKGGDFETHASAWKCEYARVRRALVFVLRTGILCLKMHTLVELVPHVTIGVARSRDVARARYVARAVAISCFLISPSASVFWTRYLVKK